MPRYHPHTAPIIALIATVSLATPALSMGLSSPDVVNGQLGAAQAWNGDGCAGGNRSPALSWWGAPPGTRSYAIAMVDLDAAGRKGFWQWLAYNLPPTTTSLPAGVATVEITPVGLPKPSQALPVGMVQALNGYHVPGYGGPCPPKGESHRYQITVYALNKASLDLASDQPAASLASQVLSHALARATLAVRAGRTEKPAAGIPVPRADGVSGDAPSGKAVRETGK